MFKVIDGILKVFNHDIQLIKGTHIIYFDPDNDEVSIDEDSNTDKIKIGQYTYDPDNKQLRLESFLSNDIPKEKYRLRRIRAESVYNRALLARGPLYDENGDVPVSTFVEGIPVDFNYTSFVASSIALSSFIWIGGRVCNGMPLLGIIDNNKQYWTAKSFVGCYEPTIGMFLTFGFITMGLSVMMAYFQQDLDWAFSRWSFVSQVYPFRRYTQIQINDFNMYSFFIDGKKYSVSPMNPEQEVSVPNVNWKISMFNLIQ